MAAEAAWVITTDIAAAERAIRIDIEETPKKGTERELLTETQIRNHVNPKRNHVFAHPERRTPFQHLHTDKGNMPRHRIDASNGEEIILNTG
jgi:hypothetical protein